MCIVFVPLVLGVLLFYKNTSLFHLSSTAILLDFVQVCGLFAALSLGWSSQASSYLGAVTFFNFNIDFLAVPCAFGGTRSYFNRFIFIMVFPLAIAAVFVLIYISWAALSRVWPHPDQRTGRQKTSAFTVLRTVAAADAKKGKRDPNIVWAQHQAPEKDAPLSNQKHGVHSSYLVPNTGGPTLSAQGVLADTSSVQGSAPELQVSVQRHYDGAAIEASSLSTNPDPRIPQSANAPDSVVAVNSSGLPHAAAVPVASSLTPDDVAKAGDSLQVYGAPDPGSAIKTAEDAVQLYTISMRRRPSLVHNGSFLRSVIGNSEHKAFSWWCLSGSCWVPYFDHRKRLNQMIDAYLLFLTLAHIPLSRNCLSFFRCVSTPDRRYLV